VLVIGAKRYKHEEHFLVEAPDGAKAYIPAWMTQRAWATSELVSLPCIELAALENLRRLLDNLVSSSPL
jgi:hypothetical protein